eukprot:scaffold75791_cov22-Tisochrysis_lutea.AAC.2
MPTHFHLHPDGGMIHANSSAQLKSVRNLTKQGWKGRAHACRLLLALMHIAHQVFHCRQDWGLPGQALQAGPFSLMPQKVYAKSGGNQCSGAPDEGLERRPAACQDPGVQGASQQWGEPGEPPARGFCGMIIGTNRGGKGLHGVPKLASPWHDRMW